MTYHLKMSRINKLIGPFSDIGILLGSMEVDCLRNVYFRLSWAEALYSSAPPVMYKKVAAIRAIVVP